MLIFCNPHNPTGRVWTNTELQKIVSISKKHKVLIVSDEIHADIIYANNKHNSLFNFSSPKCNIIVCTSPSKTFNVSGIQIANILIKDTILKKKF